MENTLDFKIVEEPKKPFAMHPKKFAMWLFLASVGMLFAAFTSAYIVRQAEGNWFFFELPGVFTYSTVVILLSTITMQLAYRSAKKDKVDAIKKWVSATAVLGVIFLALQWKGWLDLIAISAYWVGNPSGSFVYVLTGLHGLHLISAIIYLFIVLNAAWKLRIRSGDMAQMEMCLTYWHFLSGLWVYLFVFLLLYR